MRSVAQNPGDEVGGTERAPSGGRVSTMAQLPNLT